jgi:hypothetical protein
MAKETNSGRRSFFQSITAFVGLPAVAAAQGRPASGGEQEPKLLPAYARAQNHRSLKQSSHDTTGGNADRYHQPGGTQEVFNAEGAGTITHIWFTIAAKSPNHLKEIVLRAYWDGNAKPSVEAPVGDFFGLNLGKYVIYESEYLACSPGRSLNCYFAMPYRKSARMTVTNEGPPVGAFYSNIDYMACRRCRPTRLLPRAVPAGGSPQAVGERVADQRGGQQVQEPGRQAQLRLRRNARARAPDGRHAGRPQNQEGWMGEGDDMIFVDDETKPLIIGTGSEDYFLGSWNFGGRTGARAFAHRMYGAQSSRRRNWWTASISVTAGTATTR